MSEMIQGSPEWIAARLGKVTASRIADVIARTKTGWSAYRGKYMIELIAERLTGEPSPAYVSPAMRWGTVTEPEARAAYEFETDATIEAVGFVEHPRIPFAGASPDGFVGEDGLVEFKCPNPATHIDVLLKNEVPADYLSQVMWQMACTDRKWCDFVSFDPRFPEGLRLVVIRVARDEARIMELERDVIAFLAELDEQMGPLAAMCEQPEFTAEPALGPEPHPLDIPGFLRRVNQVGAA